MGIIDNIFKYKKANFDRLIKYGFNQCACGFEYDSKLKESGFEMNVTVDKNGRVTATVTDTNFNEPYTLHLIEEVSGGFVGQVRNEYTELLTDISEKCFITEIFKSNYTKRLIDYVKYTYGDELEHLWAKSPQNAIWRRKDNNKWYGIIMIVPKCRLGFDSDELIEILDMRIESENINSLVDNINYFYGYHMNKQHWFTIILDGSVSFEEICSRLSNSYIIAGDK